MLDGVKTTAEISWEEIKFSGDWCTFTVVTAGSFIPYHFLLKRESLSCGLEPTRLLYPWGFPGKNIGVGCRFLLVKSFKKLRQLLGGGLRKGSKCLGWLESREWKATERRERHSFCLVFWFTFLYLPPSSTPGLCVES